MRRILFVAGLVSGTLLLAGAAHLAFAPADVEPPPVGLVAADGSHGMRAAEAPTPGFAADPPSLASRWVHLRVHVAPLDVLYSDVPEFEVRPGATRLEIRSSDDLNMSRWVADGPNGARLAGPPTGAMDGPPAGVWTLRVDSERLAARTFEVDVLY